MSDFDVIVVGSGFGGAVSACRLATAGAKVLVLERGRRWTKDTYPRRITDPWFFNSRNPKRCNGWLDVRLFRGVTVLSGAGVGGGSLCYASVAIPADAQRFEHGWPPEITRASLDPYYKRANHMLGVQTVPRGQETYRSQLLQRAAAKLNYTARLEQVPLATSFDPQFSYALKDPIDPKHAKPFTNVHGVAQKTCVHLGNCQIGCDVGAKNTLDLNYLAIAEENGAKIWPLHVVRYIEAENNGYRVHWQRIQDGGVRPGSTVAKKVILAAGSLGSTEILLRSRDEFKTLPKIPNALGKSWSPNGNFVTTTSYPREISVHQSIGPMISSGLNFMDGSAGGARFYVGDDGLPNLYLYALATSFGGLFMRPWIARLFPGGLRRRFGEFNPWRQGIRWLGEGVDAGDGHLRLGYSCLAPWRLALKLEWRLNPSLLTFNSIIEMHRRLSAVEGGFPSASFCWCLFRRLISVHPLGGCAMGADSTTGVVDHRGEVFGYPNLYVVDGATIPQPLGRNPALTIAALAERSIEMITQNERG